MKETHLPRVNYGDKYFRLLVSLVAAVEMVLNGENIGLWRALHIPSFYPFVVISWIIAFLLTYYIYQVTCWLDKGYDWWDKPVQRFVRQVLFGVFAASLLAIGLASLYLWPLGLNIYNSQYLQYDFPVIAYMLLTFNAYYGIYYVVLFSGLDKRINLWWEATTQEELFVISTNQEHGPTQTMEEDIKPENELLDESDAEYLYVYSGTKKIKLSVADQICFFYFLDDHTWLVTFNGDRYMTNFSLSKIETKYPQAELFRINRAMLIHADAISTFESGKKSGTLQIMLKPEYQHWVNDPEMLNVSQKRVAQFRRWVKG